MSSYRYKDNTIYVDSNGAHIFTLPHGEGRVDFPTVEEAEECIDDLTNDTTVDVKSFVVHYILNASDSEAEIKVEAKDENEAIYIAKKKLGRNLYRVLNVESIDDNISNYFDL